MIIKEFNNIDEIQKYYDEIHMSYYFNDMDLVILNFNLDTKAIIYVPNIIARDIKVFSMRNRLITENEIKDSIYNRLKLLEDYGLTWGVTKKELEDD